MKGWFKFYGILVLQVWHLCAAGVTPAAPIGVIYPESQAYRKIFNTIIDGVESELGFSVDRYGLASSHDHSRLEATIMNSDNRGVIALGQQASDMLDAMKLSHTVAVRGAILPGIVNDALPQFSTLYMVPDPELLFIALLKLVPSIRNVKVLYSKDKSQFLIDKSIIAAKKLSLQLDAYPVSGLQESAMVYRKLIDTMDSEHDAIWLLQDSSILDSETILPVILTGAWERDLVTFSNNLGHVSRGVLFALFPDYARMGRTLGLMSKESLKEPKNLEVLFLQDLKLALNVRTAKHLRIDPSDAEVDLVFPAR